MAIEAGEAAQMLAEARANPTEGIGAVDPDVTSAIAMLKGEETSAKAGEDNAASEANGVGHDNGQAREPDEQRPESEEASEAKTEGQDGPDDEVDAKQNDEPDESADAKDGSETKARQSRWAKKQEELQQARAEVAEIQTHFDQLADHAKYAFDRFDEVKAENERLKARLAEYEIPEFANAEQERLWQAERRLRLYEQQEKDAAERQKLQSQAALQQQARQGVEEIKAQANKYGLQPMEIFQAYSVAFSVNPKASVAAVAKQLAESKGLVRAANVVKEQVRANGDAVPANAARGSRGAENIFADPKDDEVAEATKFLHSLR